METGAQETAPGAPAFSRLLATGRRPFLALLLLLAAAFSAFALTIRVELGSDSMVARDEEQARARAFFREAFGGGEEIVLSVTRPDLLSPAGLRLLDEVTDRAGTIPGVRRVFGLTNARQVVPGPDGAELAPLVPRPFHAPGADDRIRRALDDNPQYDGLLVSRDRRTAGILIEIGEEGGKGSLHDLIRALRALAAGYSDRAELHLTGIGVQKHDVAEFVRRDLALLVPVSVAVIALSLAATFRRLSGVLVPLSVTGVSLAGMLGAYALAGFALNPITSLLPPVVIVLSVITSVQLYSAWLRLPEESGDRAALILRETRALFLPALYVSLTTALGLLSLAATDTPAVRLFGIFGALGVMISFAVGITLVPVLLSFLPLPAAGGRNGAAAPGHRAVEWTARAAAAQPKRILLAAALLSAAGIAGTARIRNDTDLVRFMKAGAPLFRDTAFIDRALSGVHSFEYVVARKDGKPLASLDDIGRIAAFQEAARRKEHVAAVYSVADIVRLVHRAEKGGKDLRLPETEEDLRDALDLVAAGGDDGLLRKLVDEKFTAARVSVRVRAIGTSASAPLARSLIDAGRSILGDGYTLTPTGGLYQLVRDSDRLVRNQVKSFSLAALLILLAIYALFRSARTTGILLVPNAIPILATGGLMGFLGVDLSTATAMIGAVGFGVVGNNTIFYLARYRRLYRGEPRRAVAETTASMGLPLVASSLVLVLGFWVGGLGSFKPAIHFSLLMGITMITALACDLLVLPACLVLADSPRERRAP